MAERSAPAMSRNLVVPLASRRVTGWSVATMTSMVRASA